MTRSLSLDGTFVQSGGLIAFNPAITEAALLRSHVDVFVGYEAVGFAAASILSLLHGARAALLRKTRKSHGLELILESDSDLAGRQVCVIHAGDLSAEALESLSGLDIVAWLKLKEGSELVPWPPTSAATSFGTPSAPTTANPATFKREEGFVLSSGERRPSYVDVFTTLLDPGVAIACADAAGANLQNYDSIVGMANGGIFFSAVLALTAGLRPIIMDHRKADFSPVDLPIALGRTMLVDETVGSGEYFRVATRKLAGLLSEVNYLVAVRFKHRGDYEFPLMYGAIL